MPTHSPYLADAILRTALRAANQIEPPAHKSQELTAAQLERFLLRNWQEIAVKGYWGYSRQGCGEFFIFVRRALPKKIAWDQGVGAYLPAHSILGLSRSSTPSAQLHLLAGQVIAWRVVDDAGQAHC